MTPYRSLLFIPGHQHRLLAKGPTTQADGLVLDLEDSVPIESKHLARHTVGRFINEFVDKACFVRVNSVASGNAYGDLEAVVAPTLRGIFAPKVESVDEIRQLAAWLSELESASGIPEGRIELVVMLETALGVFRAYDLALASTRVGALSFASAQNGDLQADLGCDWSVEGTEMLYARSKVVLDARAAGLEYVLDGAFVDIHSLAGLIADTTLSKRLGYKGRSVIHPTHIEPVNTIYTPAVEEVAYCRRLLEAFVQAEAENKAAINFEGKLVDYAMVARARRVLAFADLLSSRTPQYGL